MWKGRLHRRAAAEAVRRGSPRSPSATRAEPGRASVRLNGCPAVAGDDGYDYGTSLYLEVPSQSWSGGRYRPSLNETDCLDLVVAKFTSTEVDFHFGPFYASAYPKFSLAPGTHVTVVVNGATATATVAYG